MDHTEAIKKKQLANENVIIMYSLLKVIALIVLILIMIFTFFNVSTKMNEFDKRQIDMGNKIELIQEKLEAYE